jgi:hypothetical protein
MKKPGGSKSGITDDDREIILSALFNDPHLFVIYEILGVSAYHCRLA